MSMGSPSFEITRATKITRPTGDEEWGFCGEGNPLCLEDRPANDPEVQDKSAMRSYCESDSGSNVRAVIQNCADAPDPSDHVGLWVSVAGDSSTACCRDLSPICTTCTPEGFEMTIPTTSTQRQFQQPIYQVCDAENYSRVSETNDFRDVQLIIGLMSDVWWDVCKVEVFVDDEKSGGEVQLDLKSRISYFA